jgi:thioredoxin 1
MVTEVSGKNFENEVVKSTLPVVVDFWAPWCGPCRMVAPVVEKLSLDYDGKIKFCKVNIDDDPEIANKYDVKSIPTLMFLKAGKAVSSLVGAQPERSIRARLESILQAK